MSKILRTAALVVGAVAVVVATGGAAAIGIGAAGTAATATTAATAATIGGISGATLGLVASGLSLASGLLAKKPAPTGGGSQTSWKADPQAGIPYVMGRTGAAGNIIARIEGDGWGGDTKNDLQTIVTVLSLGPCNAIESLKVDKAAVSFSGGNEVGEFHDFLFQGTQLGALPEAASLNVAAGSSARPTGWTTSHKLSGLCATMLRLRYDANGKHYQNGVPQPIWVVQGVKVYDPRLDSTWPGGSGACRAGVESTYVYSENPYLHALTWCIGRFQNGKRVAGIGAPVGAIDIDAFVAGANVAAANGWKVGGTVYTRPDTKWNVLKSILQAGGGEPYALGAKISCMVNTTRVSLATISAADVAGEVSVTATQGRRDRKNTSWPRYRSEAHDWEMVPLAAPVQVSSYVTEDGDERTAETEFALVQNATQAAQLGSYEIVNSREFGPITLPLKLRWIGAQPGDCVTVNIPEVGLNNQLVLLLDRQIDPGTGTVTFTARSETASKHAFALGQTGTAPPTASVSGPPLTPTPGSSAWAIADNKLSANGVTYPAIVLTGAVDSPNADEVIFDYRLYVAGAGTEANWVSAGTGSPSTVRREITSVTSEGVYEVSVRYRWRGQVSQTRLILGPVTLATDSNYTAAQAASTLAAGKSTIFYQPTPPTIAESKENDIWIDTANGNYAYRRVAGSGRLSIGGNLITLGGSYITLAWTPAADQRIDAALLAAAGAQATADGKVFCFNQENTPTAYGVGDLWYRPSTKILYRWDGTAWTNAASLGAPSGTNVGSHSADEVAAATTNFNSRNDRNSAAISDPVVATDGTAVDHTINTDGSANISFEWTWGGAEADIDGWLVYMYSSASSSPYTFGTYPNDEPLFTLPADKRALILNGVAANNYYSFAVRAYRTVDPDIAATGSILSNLVKATGTGENPYRPSANVAFGGDIIGTVNGIPAANVNVWSSISGSGKPADNATVGAPPGTNVGGTAATTVEAGANAANAGLNSDGTVKPSKVVYQSFSADTLNKIVSATASNVTATDAGEVLLTLSGVDTKPSQGGYVHIILTADLLLHVAEATYTSILYARLQRSPHGAGTWTEINSWKMGSLGNVQHKDTDQSGSVAVRHIYLMDIQVSAATQYVDVPPSDGSYDYRWLVSKTSDGTGVTPPESGAGVAKNAKGLALSVKVAA